MAANEWLQKEPRAVWTCVISIYIYGIEQFGWINMRAITFFRLWTKVHHVTWKSFVRIFPLARLWGLIRWILSQRGRNRCRSHSFRFWISGVVPEIFAIKVESCQKSRWISDVFALPNFRGPAFQKLYTCYDPCLAARSMENVLWGYAH